MNRDNFFMNPEREKETKETKENRKEEKTEGVANNKTDKNRLEESLNQKEQVAPNPTEEVVKAGRELEKKEKNAPEKNAEKKLSIDTAMKVVSEETFNVERDIKTSFSEISSFGSDERKKLARFRQITEDLRNSTRDRGLDFLLNDFHEIFQSTGNFENKIDSMTSELSKKFFSINGEIERLKGQKIPQEQLIKNIKQTAEELRNIYEDYQNTVKNILSQFDSISESLRQHRVFIGKKAKALSEYAPKKDWRDFPLGVYDSEFRKLQSVFEQDFNNQKSRIRNSSENIAEEIKRIARISQFFNEKSEVKQKDENKKI